MPSAKKPGVGGADNSSSVLRSNKRSFQWDETASGHDAAPVEDHADNCSAVVHRQPNGRFVWRRPFDLMSAVRWDFDEVA